MVDFRSLIGIDFSAVVEREQALYHVQAVTGRSINEVHAAGKREDERRAATTEAFDVAVFVGNLIRDLDD